MTLIPDRYPVNQRVNPSRWFPDQGKVFNMSTVSRTAGATAVSVLNTVSTVARSAQRLVTTATSGLDMLDTFVEKSRAKQIASSEFEMETFFKELHEEQSMATSERQLALATKLASNAELKKLYEENHKQFDTVMERVRSKIGDRYAF
jgi:hypothetical protein